MDKHVGKKILYWDTWFMTELFQFVFKGQENTKEHAMVELPSGGSVATSAFSAGRMSDPSEKFLLHVSFFHSMPNPVLPE